MLLNIFKILLIVIISTCSFANDDVCNSIYKNKRLTREELINIINNRAVTNLCGVNLKGQDLTGLNLSGMNLSFSDFTKTILNNVDFSETIITKGFFRWSQIKHANFESANLTQSNFSDVDLKHANFNRAKLLQATIRNSKASNISAIAANFTQAILENSEFINSDFTFANLQGASFEGSDLHAVNFTQANMQNTIFNPKFGTLPDIISLAAAKNFSDIIFYRQDVGAPVLISLREAYKKTGIKYMERLITSMIKKQEMQDKLKQPFGLAWAEGALSLVLFYKTCNFGLEPNKALLIFLLSIIVFVLPYRLSCSNLLKNHGIVKILNKQEYLIKTNKKISNKRLLTKENLLQEIQLLAICSYFSLLSAFQIGWEDFNIANWISRIQVQEYQLKPKGWVRPLCGLQGIIGFYLVIIWALSYFGRPFEW